jgi:hypothetical protein
MHVCGAGTGCIARSIALLGGRFARDLGAATASQFSLHDPTSGEGWLPFVNLLLW